MNFPRPVLVFYINDHIEPAELEQFVKNIEHGIPSSEYIKLYLPTSKETRVEAVNPFSSITAEQYESLLEKIDNYLEKIKQNGN